MFTFTNDNRENEKLLDELDPNLQQGIAFLEYENLVKKMTEPNLPLIEATSSPNLGSLVEGLKDRSDYSKESAAVNQVIKNILKEIEENEDEFNNLLNKYHTLYKNVIKHKLNVFVTTDDLKHYYINVYGYKQQIEFEDVPTGITFQKMNKNILDDYKDGATLTLTNNPDNIKWNTVPNLIGKNIRLTTDDGLGEVAWISAKGFKHKYSSGNTDHCKGDENVIEVDKAVWNLFPLGKKITSSNQKICKLDLKISDIKSLEKLQVISKKLDDKALEIATLLQKLATFDTKLEKEYHSKMKTLTEKTSAIRNATSGVVENGKRKDSNMTRIDYSGEMDYQRLSLEAHKYKYIFYLVILILIVLTLVVAAGNNTLFWWLPPLIILIIIIGLYYLIKYLYRRDIL